MIYHFRKEYSMDILIWLNLAAFIFAGAGFIFGASKHLKPHKPLYASMITLGIGCVMIGRAYTITRLITGLAVTGVFHVGMLGTVGAFAFFFSANFGQIDSLVDDGSREYRKYRIIALAGVLITAALYMLILFSPAPIAEKISYGVTALAIAAASYFHVKHLLIPDVDYGVVSCQRGYNLLALIYGILCMLEMSMTANYNAVILIIVFVLECIVSGIMIPVMDKGVQKWSR